MGAHRLEELEAAHQVGVGVGLRVLQAVADAGLGGEVDHDLGRGSRHERAQEAGRLDPALDRLEARMAGEFGVPGALEADIVVVGEAVEAGHGVAFGQQQPAEMEADEAGRAGHKYAHVQSC
ncbi:hypothetical protein LDDCCGHA_5337 [Methylobacterium oxalidis]|nr:hypothetical protein LDDCCGHA_5337 [Methylobacterium oxalidis]